ncbi:MAG: hypothetical protein ACJAQT_000070 [Akkermansiaceae bacterium]|jgi:hypothetical protein
MTDQKQKPVHDVRFGTVKVAIWANKSHEGKTFHSFDLRRSYRDQQGEWQEQKISLNLNEIAKVRGALAKAYEDYHILPEFKRDEASTSQGAAEGAES